MAPPSPGYLRRTLYSTGQRPSPLSRSCDFRLCMGMYNVCIYIYINIYIYVHTHTRKYACIVCRTLSPAPTIAISFSISPLRWVNLRVHEWLFDTKGPFSWLIVAMVLEFRIQGYVRENCLRVEQPGRSKRDQCCSAWRLTGQE